jgi:hypothetical protein
MDGFILLLHRIESALKFCPNTKPAARSDNQQKAQTFDLCGGYFFGCDAFEKSTRS